MKGAVANTGTLCWTSATFALTGPGSGHCACCPPIFEADALTGQPFSPTSLSYCTTILAVLLATPIIVTTTSTLPVGLVCGTKRLIW